MVAICHPTPIVAPTSRPLPGAVYRRRRLAALGALLVAAALALAATQLLLARIDGSAGAGPRPVATVAVVVEPGDTVWSLAAELAPGADPRPVVDAVVAANGGAGLTVGQRLEIPLP